LEIYLTAKQIKGMKFDFDIMGYIIYQDFVINSEECCKITNLLIDLNFTVQ